MPVAHETEVLGHVYRRRMESIVRSVYSAQWLHFMLKNMFNVPCNELVLYTLLFWSLTGFVFACESSEKWLLYTAKLLFRVSVKLTFVVFIHSDCIGGHLTMDSTHILTLFKSVEMFVLYSLFIHFKNNKTNIHWSVHVCVSVCIHMCVYVCMCVYVWVPV